MSLAVFFRGICSRKESEMQKTHKSENGGAWLCPGSPQLHPMEEQACEEKGKSVRDGFSSIYLFSVVEFGVEYSPARFQKMPPYKCRKETAT